MSRDQKNGERSFQMKFFCYCTVNAWNELSKIVTQAKNINILKTKLDEIWIDLP